MSYNTESLNISQQQRPRAVFSSEDFNLIKIAIGHYLQQLQDDPAAVKYSNLYHRLGRLA